MSNRSNSKSESEGRGRNEHSRAEYWDIAARYWRDIATVNPYWAWSAFYSQKIGGEPMNVLVMGVTDGSFLRLLRKFRPKAWVCGIDFSYAMIRGVKNVEKNLVCGGGNALPFKSATFDVVLSDYFLSVIPAFLVEETIGEMGRVLKRDGFLITKELRDRGHTLVWGISSLVTGALLGLTLLAFPPIAVLPGVFFVLAFFAYNPVSHRMGVSSPICKFFLHLLRFTFKKRHLPTVREGRDLYFLSKKDLHVFTDREMRKVLDSASLVADIKTGPMSWNFSIVGVKK